MTTVESATQAIIMAARSNGCTCDVEVELHRIPARGEVHEVDVVHEDWCPLLNLIQGGLSK